MRAAYVLALLALVLGAVVASSRDESTCVFGEIEDNACVCENEYTLGARCNIRLEQVSNLESCLFVYEDDQDKTEAECLMVVPFECDNEFAFAIFVRNESGGMQVLATDVASGSDTELELCSSPHGAPCADCFTLNNIEMTNNVVTADVMQSSVCTDEDDLFYELGPIEHTGAQCGAEGYFYLPCGFTPPESAGEVEEETKRSVVDDEPKLVGAEHCVFYTEYPHTPLICPVVVMDTCGGSAYSISYGGVPIFLELEEGKDDQACEENNIGTVCLDVVEVGVSSGLVTYTSTVTLTVTNDYYTEGTYTLELPRLTEEFPECGERKDNCGRDLSNSGGSDSGASGSGASGSVEESSEGGDGDGDGDGDDGGDDDDDNDNWFLWLIAVPVAFVALILFAAAVILGLVLMYKRRNRTLTLSDAGLEMDVEELGDE